MVHAKQKEEKDWKIKSIITFIQNDKIENNRYEEGKIRIYQYTCLTGRQVRNVHKTVTGHMAKYLMIMRTMIWLQNKSYTEYCTDFQTISPLHYITLHVMMAKMCIFIFSLYYQEIKYFIVGHRSKVPNVMQLITHFQRNNKQFQLNIAQNIKIITSNYSVKLHPLLMPSQTMTSNTNVTRLWSRVCGKSMTWIHWRPINLSLYIVNYLLVRESYKKRAWYKTWPQLYYNVGIRIYCNISLVSNSSGL
jgi:hypothetical protein